MKATEIKWKENVFSAKAFLQANVVSGKSQCEYISLYLNLERICITLKNT